MTNILDLIGRSEKLFLNDINSSKSYLEKEISSSSFLVIGGAGSIGQAVVKELFKRNPKKIHVVDISENNLVELVRDLRSSLGYIKGEFKTFSLDIGSDIYDAFINVDGQYDYVLNLSALKHVRSEEDEFTLMRMIDVNILNTDKTILQSIQKGVKKYFCVSTDKAANPVNMMGASKRIMELFLMQHSIKMNISTARFANVAFSDGSLLHGFNQRIIKKQPIVAPRDIRRYFVTPQEAGELCIMSCIFGENRDIYFPKLSESLNLVSFADIAVKFLEEMGYEPFICNDENEARILSSTLPEKGKWPCLFTNSDTTGEKSFEEFYTESEEIDLLRFEDIGIVKNKYTANDDKIQRFKKSIIDMKSLKQWDKRDIINLFNEILPEFKHKETGKFLDSKM